MEDLQEMLKKIGLSDSSQANKPEKKNEVYLKEVIRFLRKFAVFLGINKGQDSRLVMASELAPISKELLDHKEFVLFNTEDIYRRFKLELSKKDANFPETGAVVLEQLSVCLQYIVNSLIEEKDPGKTLTSFMELKKCIFTFSTTPIILDTNAFQNLVGHFIGDLLKIITGADGVFRRSLRHLKIFNVIKEILTHLAMCDIYFEVIVLEIKKKFDCALTYYAANKELSSYIASETVVFEYFFLILKQAISNAVSRGCKLKEEHVVGVKKTLGTLKECLGSNRICPTLIKNLIDHILMML